MHPHTLLMMLPIPDPMDPGMGCIMIPMHVHHDPMSIMILMGIMMHPS